MLFPAAVANGLYSLKLTFVTALVVAVFFFFSDCIFYFFRTTDVFTFLLVLLSTGPFSQSNEMLEFELTALSEVHNS